MSRTTSERIALLRFLRRVVALLIAVTALTLGGGIAFSLTEHVDVWQGLIRSLDTVATVGSIPEPASTGGQVVKVLLIVLGVGTLFYALVTVTEFFVAGHLAELLAERRMQKRIDATADHHIICGFGRVGRQAARDLRGAGARYVVVDASPHNRDLVQGVGVRFIEGDASNDEVLRAAGIDRARSLIACADDDAQNIFITLTARELRPDLAIVARAAVEDSEKKLLRAGADRVISPYKSSGTEMARLALHPQVTGSVDVAADYRLEELIVSEDCQGAGKTVGDVRGGAFIVGVRHADGSFQPQPPAEAMLSAGDVLMAIGTPRTLDRLEALFERVSPAASA
jgi:voltage-gated potassium channel